MIKQRLAKNDLSSRVLDRRWCSIADLIIAVAIVLALLPISMAATCETRSGGIDERTYEVVIADHSVALKIVYSGPGPSVCERKPRMKESPSMRADER
jgi:hypothetical protein